MMMMLMMLLMTMMIFCVLGGERVQMKFQYRAGAVNRKRQIICFAWCNSDHKKGPPKKQEASKPAASRPVNALVKNLVHEFVAHFVICCFVCSDGQVHSADGERGQRHLRGRLARGRLQADQARGDVCGGRASTASVGASEWHMGE